MAFEYVEAANAKRIEYELTELQENGEVKFIKHSFIPNSISVLNEQAGNLHHQTFIDYINTHVRVLGAGNCVIRTANGSTITFNSELVLNDSFIDCSYAADIVCFNIDTDSIEHRILNRNNSHIAGCRGDSYVGIVDRQNDTTLRYNYTYTWIEHPPASTLSSQTQFLVLNVDGIYYSTFFEGTSWGPLSRTMNAVLIGGIIMDEVYTVSIADSINGSASASVESAKEGDTVTVTLTPDTGYATDSERTSITSTVGVYPSWDSPNSFHFTMPAADVTINPVFAKYGSISVEQSTGGTATTSISSALPGATITVTMNAAEDYSIDTDSTSVRDLLQTNIPITWESGTRFTFVMPSTDVIVYPRWKENVYYSITIGRVTGGTIQASKTVNINPGETVRLTLTPNQGYSVDRDKVHAYMGIDVISLTWVDDTHADLTLPPGASTITTIIITGTFRAGNPYAPGGNSDSGSGGGGTYDGTSDEIPIPPPPLIQATDSGIMRIFKPTSAQALAFGSFLWSDLISWDTVTKLFTDPIESVISYHMLPITPDTGANVDVTFMGVSSGVSMPPVTNQYVDSFMGSVRIDEYFGSFLDYSPLTKVNLYLPYIGETELSADEIMNKTLSVYYRIDVLTGSCLAYILGDGNVLYQFSGNCLIPLPLSQANYARIIGAGLGIVNTGLSMLSAGGTALSGAAGAIGGLGGILSGAAAGIRNGLDMASPVTSALQGKRSGGHISIGSGISGFFGVQYPYLTITRPRQSMASDFNHYQGYPANVTSPLSSQKGYVKVNSADLTGVTCTNEELIELHEILRAGVYV